MNEIKKIFQQVKEWFLYKRVTSMFLVHFKYHELDISFFLSVLKKMLEMNFKLSELECYDTDGNWYISFEETLDEIKDNIRNNYPNYNTVESVLVSKEDKRFIIRFSFDRQENLLGIGIPIGKILYSYSYKDFLRDLNIVRKNRLKIFFQLCYQIYSFEKPISSGIEIDKNNQEKVKLNSSIFLEQTFSEVNLEKTLLSLRACL